ncbi:DegT/DnrJ/EryC1/StrS family aminotransferase [Massilia sp. PAMC28688]|uniref:DegT/DnrJ/EryC1/StrS family aminotransferase n=1 Tax=Massilia sp. PAMC28688 TaxID=2861283 RepID=UPI001C638F9E|nr:DegT/DnrJ/EryC1/StrS family aminotransferase [Massilia sp. PAMC28688]QYF95069.1 DegT/DnrJ/EryC1/StrS family aminotransferase [Massilia sp. PAMC28688]
MLSPNELHPPGQPPSQPRVPLAPLLSLSTFAAPRLPRPACVLDAGAVRLVTSGRIAIALALREMGVGAGDEVLVPAYHSMSMIPPVLSLGAHPVFYKVGADAALDLDDVASKLTAATRAIMVTSYFGIPQDLARIRAFCDLHGLLMLEDCAHCFFGEHGGRPVGSWGDYAIASSMKFFPIYEGGALVSARHALTTGRLSSAGRGFEAKAALNALERSFAYGRLPLVKALLWLPLRLKSALWNMIKRRAPAGAPALTPSSSDSSYDFDPRWLDKQSSRFSRFVVRRASHARIVAQRRANYRFLELACASLPLCRPLFAALPPGACPWLFPLVVEQPEKLFRRLHNAGVPMTRFAEALWPGVDAGVCANSVHLSRHIIAFPCHQALLPEELAWMSGAIREALTA